MIALRHKAVQCMLAACTTTCRLSVFAIAALFLFPACSRLQLPAFDPNGSSIFLPPPNFTPVELPKLHNGSGILPTPAYQTPAMPPPCLENDPSGFCNLFDRTGGLAERISSRKPGKAGEIQMTPLSVVAPIDGEVVLLAGICGKDGFLVNRQPLEWMLAPDSVGTIIEVGDDNQGHLDKILHHKQPKIEKLDVDFARARTSSKAYTITKGSPNCTDKIPVQEGQTWVSISSPTEGVTHVTALAPDSEIWDRRRQTATIYWIDAQWQFPEPQSARAGSAINLTTRVTRAANMVPAQGWRVRYTIIDPTVAQFSRIAGETAEVAVNADGQANISLVAGPAGRGTTPILVDVYKPEDPQNRLPLLRLGGGQTVVTFSSPQLALQATGPQSGVASPGSQLSYFAAMANAGDIDIENAQLVVRWPEGWTLAGTPVPEPQVFTSYMVWDQGLLAAGQQLDVQFDLIAGREANYEVVIEARGEPSQVQTQRLPISIVQSSIETRFAPANGVAQAEVGDTVVYEIDVKNNGRTAITDMMLFIETSTGLVHAEQQTNLIRNRLPVLPAGETWQVDVAFEVQQQGQLDAVLKVLQGQQVLSQKEASIQGLAARQKRADITAAILDFPDTLAVGDQPEARIRISNPGETTLSNIQVEITYDPAIEPRFIDRDNRDANRYRAAAPGSRTAIWNAPDLLPQVDTTSGLAIADLRIAFECMFPTNQGRILIRATCDQQVESSATINFVANASISPGASNGNPSSPGSPNGQPARSGAWRMVLVESDDPVILGETMRYFLSIRNEQNVADKNIRIRLTRPDGIALTVTSGGVTIPVQEDPNDRRVVILPPINFVRAGERLDYTLIVTPQVLQQMTFGAALVSDGVRSPVTAEEVTSVVSRAR